MGSRQDKLNGGAGQRQRSSDGEKASATVSLGGGGAVQRDDALRKSHFDASSVAPPSSRLHHSALGSCMCGILFYVSPRCDDSAAPAWWDSMKATNGARGEHLGAAPLALAVFLLLTS